MSRTLLAAAFTALATPALAGGCGGAECYQRVVTPPVYGTVSERVMVRAPRHYASTVPGEFTTVTERVLVAPPGKVWQVTTDAYGNTVGCWVATPARYAVRHRTVMVRPPQTLHHHEPAQYALQQRQVLVEPGRAGWVPIGGGYGHAGGYGGGGLIGSAVGLGVGAAAAGVELGAGLAGGVLGGF